MFCVDKVIDKSKGMVKVNLGYFYILFYIGGGGWSLNIFLSLIKFFLNVS